MIVKVIELFLVLACLQSSEEFTCNQSKQLQNERHAMNCSSTCVKNQNETEEEPENCAEVNKEIEFHGTSIKRPRWRGCGQILNGSVKPRNCGRFRGRNKREEEGDGGAGLMDCERCRILQQEEKTIECEDICGPICRYCEERSRTSGEDCSNVCGEKPITCSQCRHKEQQKQPVDCEFSCAKSCYECEKNQGTSGEDCDMVCGRPRLPCEECRKDEKEDAKVNCEWTCEASCTACRKMEKRTAKTFHCGMYCGVAPSPCLECKRNEAAGKPVDCSKKCAIPCLECRKAHKNGRPVDCKQICESSCFGCRLAARTTGKLDECEKFCGKRQRSKPEETTTTTTELPCEACKKKRKSGESISCEKVCSEVQSRMEDEMPLNCEDCRQKEEDGREVDCEYICDEDCRACEEAQRNTGVLQYCERPCGLPAQPCRTCRRREGPGRNCEWTCATSCIMCERMEPQITGDAHCELFCGYPRLPCRGCRQLEKQGQHVDCTTICVTPCRECRDDQRSSVTSHHCEMFCGVQAQPVRGDTRPSAACLECRKKQAAGDLVDCSEVCPATGSDGELDGGSDGELGGESGGELGGGKGASRSITCVSCNGIIHPECNVPFKDKKEFTSVCKGRCEAVTFYKTGTMPESLQEKLAIRGCNGVERDIPADYTIDLIGWCEASSRCNANDTIIFTWPILIQDKTSASASHRVWIHLTWLLFTYHSVF